MSVFVESDDEDDFNALEFPGNKSAIEKVYRDIENSAGYSNL